MREQAILNLVAEQGFVRIEMLAEHFGVAQQTIRRDVRALCDQGLVRRHYGGVGPMEFSGDNLEFDRRQLLYPTQRRQIAEAVAHRVPDGAALSIGIGTTPCHIAEALTGHHDLLVITPNLRAAEILAQSSNCRIVIPGGEIRNRHRDVNLAGAADLCGQYRVDFAIFGVGGINLDGALLDFSQEEVNFRAAMMANAQERILVADHSKIGRNAPARGGSIADINWFVTDIQPPNALQSAIRGHSVRVEITSGATELRKKQAAGGGI
jgi:DeoR family glycerol-3-phosphate regulon repressor